MNFRVSFYLGDMFHSYVKSARSESDCILKIINAIPYPELLHGFKIERYFEIWN